MDFSEQYRIDCICLFVLMPISTIFQLYRGGQFFFFLFFICFFKSGIYIHRKAHTLPPDMDVQGFTT
jgi:hypothetical protein